MSDPRVNRFAGMGAHQSSRSETDVWLTPPAIIDALGGPESFDLDPASPIDRPWPTATRHFTVEDNGLLQRWAGRIWLNPPYSNPLISRFMARMAEHDHGIALVFARTETEMFHRYVWERAAGLLFLRGRLNFHKPDGSRARKNGGAPSVLIAYGSADLDVLAGAELEGSFVPLRFARTFFVDMPEETWKEVVLKALSDKNDATSLADIYRMIRGHPKTRGNPHWKDKIRQVLQKGPFERAGRGVWRAAREAELSGQIRAAFPG